MAQQVTIEVAEPSDQRTAEQVSTFIRDLGSNGTEIKRVAVEIETDDLEHVPFPSQVRTHDGDTETEEPAGAVRLNPGSRRWTLASVLSHGSEPLDVSDFVELSEGADWAVTQAQASAELYTMYQDGVVDREGTPYRYELTEIGEQTLEDRAGEEDTAIEPDPF